MHQNLHEIFILRVIHSPFQNLALGGAISTAQQPQRDQDGAKNLLRFVRTCQPFVPCFHQPRWLSYSNNMDVSSATCAEQTPSKARVLKRSAKFTELTLLTTITRLFIKIHPRLRDNSYQCSRGCPSIRSVAHPGLLWHRAPVPASGYAR